MITTYKNNYQNTLTLEFASSTIARIFFLERGKVQDSQNVPSKDETIDFSSLNDSQLTEMGMHISEISLAKEWDNEEDSIWDTV